MKIEFTKMNGAGNDFVLIDNRDRALTPSGDQVARICDRRRGVGADGLIMVEPAKGADFYMRFYNADGSPAEMCGNGSRCAARFAVGLGLGEKRADSATVVRFSTDSGGVEAVDTGDAVSTALMDAVDMKRGIPVTVARGPAIVHFMRVGTRHAVWLAPDLDSLTALDIYALGRELRNDPAFAPAGANVNFACIDGDGLVHLRTYEKGVEAETHACGTGSVAAAVLLAHEGRIESPVSVVQKQGDVLRVSFRLNDDGADQVVLDGPVTVNFTGSLDI